MALGNAGLPDVPSYHLSRMLPASRPLKTMLWLKSKEPWVIARLMIGIFLVCGVSLAQDSPSLGDLARQQRQQKEQAKTTSGKTPKIITNELLPRHAAETVTSEMTSPKDAEIAVASTATKQTAESWKAQILAEKNQIASLQGQVEELNESIRFAPGNCVANCVSWNERQRDKQQQVERMQSQLADQKKHLEELQESARKQGYGSAVYEP